MFNSAGAPRRRRAVMAAVAGLGLAAGLLVQAAPVAAATGGGSISGSVVDWGGTAVPNVKVCAIADIDHSLDRCVTADAYGRYSISGLADEEYMVKVTAPGWDNQDCCTYGDFPDDRFMVTFVQVMDGDDHPGIQVRLRGMGRITGKITDTKGKPLAGARIYVSPNWSPGVYTADANGRYTFDWLEGQGTLPVAFGGADWSFMAKETLPDPVHGKVFVKNFVVPVGTGVQGRISFSPEGGSYGVFAFEPGKNLEQGRWSGVGFGTAAPARSSSAKYRIWLEPGQYVVNYADGVNRLFWSPDGTTHNPTPIPVKVRAGKVTTLPTVSYQRPIAAGTVQVAGAAKVGAKLTARTASWPSGTWFTYQWLRDGKPIRWAWGSAYRTSYADWGHRISVTVTGHKSGYRPSAVTSAATARVSRK